MKKCLWILLFLILTITLLNVVSATDTNFTDVSTNQITSVQDNSQSDNTVTTQKNNEISISDEESSSNEEYTDEDCCSTIVQGVNNDTACAFRRDNLAKITVRVEHNDSVIRHYKTDGSYFVHMMVTKEGWVIGTGGLDSASTVRKVEDYSLAMVKNNQISDYYINKIFSLKSQTILCHYVIKSPNGTFRLMIKRDGKILKDSGVLKPGQYIVVPNSRIYYKKGTLSNFKDTQESMLSYCQSLSAHDKYGVYRRQIVTFYYKNNIVNSTVKVVAANDNGRHVGVSSARYVDNIRTNTRFISSNSIPVLDKHINVDEVNFVIRKTRTNVTSQTKYVNGSNVVLTATVKDEFGRNVNNGFVSVIVDGKTLKYRNGSVIYANVKNGYVSLNTTLPDIWKKNNFTYYMRYYGNSVYNDSIGTSANVLVTKLINLKTVHNPTVYYGGTLRINSSLVYVQNNSNIEGGKVFYKINGKTIRNGDGTTLFKDVANGKVTFDYTFDSKYKAKSYVLTTIFVNGIYRKEYNTTITIRKIPTKILSPRVSVKDNVVSFKANLIDQNSIPLKYASYLSIKINGKTLKEGNVTKIFNITNGNIDFNFTLPYKLRTGKHVLTVVVPELKETLGLRNNYTFSIV